MKFKTFEELKLSGNLPSPAGVGMRILQITRTENYSAQEMGEVIMADSSLTGRVLKLANTASNSGLEPATTVSGAIMRLGSRTVRDMALAFSLVSERSAGTCQGFEYELYWSRSLARAVCAQMITRALGSGRPEEAYICGLLGEVGRLALASVYAEQYAVIVASGVEGDLPSLLAREDADFNINHAQVGSCMLSDWGLPEAFSEGVEGYCTSRDLASTDAGLHGMAMVLRFAHVLAQAFVGGEALSRSRWVKVGEGLDLLREHLGMERREFTRFCDACVREWQAWGESLEVSTHDELRFAEIFRCIEESASALRGGGVDIPVPLFTPEPAVTAKGPEPTPRAEDRFKVLAVDDDAASLAHLSMRLESEGYEVITARGGKAGLREALSELPDIVIAEGRMSGLDGLELCRALRRTAAGGRMYFLLMTDVESEELVVDAFEAGADDFVTKPFIPRLLCARIKGGIRLARMQRKIEEDRQTMVRQVAELGMLTRKLRTASLTDALTDLPNRRYCMKRLDSEWASTQRTGRPLSVVMLDIDRFKAVNDDHGHDIGDMVLREAARVLDEAIRSSDEVCRVGGEEFLIIAKNTGVEECEVVAERVRTAMEANIIEQTGFARAVTISLGVATSEAGYEGVHELLKAADEALFFAKNSGRNQVRRATEVARLRRSA